MQLLMITIRNYKPFLVECKTQENYFLSQLIENNTEKTLSYYI